MSNQAASSRFSFPRFNTANTTVRRVDGPAFGRLLSIADNVGQWTRRTHPTRADLFEAISDHLGVEVDVARKTLQYGTTLGLFEDLADVTGGLVGRRTPPAGTLTMFDEADIDHAGRSQWVRLCPAGESFLTSTDLVAAVAHQMLRTVVDGPSGGQVLRPAVAALSFLQEVSGDRWVSTAEYALLCAATGREGPWAGVAGRLEALRSVNVDVHEHLEATIWDHDCNRAAREALSVAVDQVLNGSGPFEDRLDTHRKALMPGMKASAWPAARESLVEAVAGGDRAFTERLRDMLCARAADTCLDMNHTYLAELQQAELVERQGTGRDARWRISPFGEEALRSCARRPPVNHAAALAELRRSVEFGFTDRRRDRAARFADLRVATRRGDHPGLLEDLSWDRWRGRSEPARYEWAAVLATLALVDVADSWDPFDPAEGLRTRLSFDLTPLGPAPGGGADAYITSRDGLTLVLEVTGVEGDRQISQELEPTTRHLRDRLSSEGDAVMVFVAPAVSERFVAHWLGVAAFEDPARPAVCVPLSELQLRRLVESGADLVALCRAVAEATSRVSEEALAGHGLGWAQPAARALLAEVDSLVTAAV